MTQAAPDESGPTPLTAVDAFGDFTTLDYCSLLDLPKVAAGNAVRAAPDSSFESCRAEVSDGATRRAVTIGPLAFDTDPNLRPYEFSGPIPDGVGVQQSMFNDQTECTRAVTFADGIRLSLTVADVAAPSPAAARCTEVDTAVGSALGAITDNHVGRLDFAEHSWGRVAPCPLLDVHDLDAASGAGTQPAAGLSGHSCIRGKVSLKFTVDSVDTAASGGSVESLGGRKARVNVSGAFCTVTTSQTASGPPGRTEKAEISVVETAGTAGDATCDAARSAANAILPRLPRA